jgi:hypothetical protein
VLDTVSAADMAASCATCAAALASSELASSAAAIRRAAAAALDCSTLQRTQIIPVSRARRVGQWTRPDFHGWQAATHARFKASGVTRERMEGRNAPADSGRQAGRQRRG